MIHSLPISNISNTCGRLKIIRLHPSQEYTTLGVRVYPCRNQSLNELFFTEQSTIIKAADSSAPTTRKQDPLLSSWVFIKVKHIAKFPFCRDKAYQRKSIIIEWPQHLNSRAIVLLIQLYTRLTANGVFLYISVSLQPDPTEQALGIPMTITSKPT